ncbi:MAG: Gfo/Idh/MocA family oxidoreductase [Dehalococcoidia bacterium]
MVRVGKPLSVGIVGAGWVATARHIPAFQRDPRVRVAALFDLAPGKAGEVARQYRIPSAFHDLSEFLATGPDIVAICTPPWTHAPIAVEALHRGCHVLVEKPMAMSSEEASAMIDAAREGGARLCVAHNFLFSRSMRKALSLIERGMVGEVQHAIALQLSSPRRRLPRWYPDLPGGLFFDESPHMIYLLRRFLGDLSVAQAWAEAAPPGMDQRLDRVEARLQNSEHSAHLNMSFRSPISEWLVAVVGTQRVLVVDVFRDILAVQKPDGAHGSADVLKSSSRLFLQGLMGFATSGALFATKRLLYGHETLVRRFIDAVVDGGAVPVAPEEGMAVVQTMESILKQAFTSMDSTKSAGRVPTA